jgi:hypothetical protein
MTNSPIVSVITRLNMITVWWWIILGAATILICALCVIGIRWGSRTPSRHVGATLVSSGEAALSVRVPDNSGAPIFARSQSIRFDASRAADAPFSVWLPQDRVPYKIVHASSQMLWIRANGDLATTISPSITQPAWIDWYKHAYGTFAYVPQPSIRVGAANSPTEARLQGLPDVDSLLLDTMDYNYWISPGTSARTFLVVDLAPASAPSAAPAVASSARNGVRDVRAQPDQRAAEAYFPPGSALTFDYKATDVLITGFAGTVRIGSETRDVSPYQALQLRFRQPGGVRLNGDQLTFAGVADSVTLHDVGAENVSAESLLERNWRQAAPAPRDWVVLVLGLILGAAGTIVTGKLLN